jgi:diacylglycerol kinase family enzyme
MMLASQPETVKEVGPMAIRPPVKARTVIISMNPRAGSRWRHDRIRAIESALSAASYEVLTTGDLDELARISREAAQAGELRAVVAVGGDGTASVVRNQVPLVVPLLAVPMGTENLLGRYAAQRSDAAGVLRTVDEGVTIGLDLGRANGRYFVLMISAGFDAAVIRYLHENRQGNIRRTAYLLPILQSLRSYRFPEMELYWEAATEPRERRLRCRWLFGFNFPMYGLGLSIAPEADACDGLLDVCAFERGRLWSIVRYLWHVKRGGHLELADTSMQRVRRFRLDAVDTPNTAYQLDGDHGGVLPVDVDVLPGELKLLVSRETAVRLGFALSGDDA